MSNLSSIFPVSLHQPELVPRSDPQHVLQNAPAQPATQMHHLEARISALETIVAAQLSQINTLRIDLDSMKRQRLQEPLHQQSANPQSATSMSMSRNWRAARGSYQESEPAQTRHEMQYVPAVWPTGTPDPPPEPASPVPDLEQIRDRVQGHLNGHMAIETATAGDLHHANSIGGEVDEPARHSDHQIPAKRPVRRRNVRIV